MFKFTISSSLCLSLYTLSHATTGSRSRHPLLQVQLFHRKRAYKGISRGRNKGTYYRYRSMHLVVNIPINSRHWMLSAVIFLCFVCESRMERGRKMKPWSNCGDSRSTHSLMRRPRSRLLLCYVNVNVHANIHTQRRT